MLWGFKQKTVEQSSSGWVGVYETPSSLSAAYALREGSELTVKTQFFQLISSGDAGIKALSLEKFVQEHHLQGVPCFYVVSEGDYSLHLVESPAVAIHERSKAVSWLLRDLINFPIEEAVIDTFELPSPRAKDHLDMLYAVIIRKSLIATIENFINQSGLILSFIDIPELVLKNLIGLDPDQAEGGALMQLHSRGGRLLLRENAHICMVRSFDLSLDDLSTEVGLKSLESLCLEIQRSFDYVNSLFRKNINTRVVLTPAFLNMNLIQESIKTTLGFETAIFDLEKQLRIEKKMSETEHVQCLLAIGAILREKSLDHESTNQSLSN